MRHILALLMIPIPMVVGCKSKIQNLLDVKAIWQCESNTLVSVITGNYPKGKVVKYQLFADGNLNKKFDAYDQMIGYENLYMIRSGELTVTNPIKLSESWIGRSLFIRLCADGDTLIHPVIECEHVKEITTPQ